MRVEEEKNDIDDSRREGQLRGRSDAGHLIFHNRSAPLVLVLLMLMYFIICSINNNLKYIGSFGRNI